MLHPSYTDLMQVINDEADNEHPTVNSRYSVVLATAKRARQLIDKAPAFVSTASNKPLSIAVEELNQGKVKIINEETAQQSINE